jgi:hypothetical protein
MDGRALTFADATSAHFDAIFRLEREGRGSCVGALTEGLALDEAVRRGHYVIVALEMLGYAVDAVTMERAL